MTGKRKCYSADFEAEVALEALKGEQTLSQFDNEAPRPSDGYRGLAQLAILPLQRLHLLGHVAGHT
jgi:hypothetical protein